MTKQVLIYFEVNNGKIEQVSKEILSHCVQNFGECEYNGVVISNETVCAEIKKDLDDLPLNNVYFLQDNVFDVFNACVFADALSDLIIEIKPDILLVGATDNGRELAPRTASKLEIGLTADCTDLQVDEDFSLIATRPTYGGKMMAMISSKTLPNFATVRPGAFKYIAAENNTDTKFIAKYLNTTGLNCLLEIINCTEKPQQEDWTCSEIIVAGGLGLQSKENFKLIYELAEKIGAKPAATRAAVERGWADCSIQVGQTGFSVSPKLYLAFGISGAMQHLTGITNADKIIAINIDKNAPIVQSADVSIITDAVSLIKELLNG